MTRVAGWLGLEELVKRGADRLLSQARLCSISGGLHNSMTRVQILLSEEEDRRLEELAAARSESKSSLVRRAVGLFLRVETESHEPLRELIGHAGPTGRRRVAREHDRLLAATERRRSTR